MSHKLTDLEKSIEVRIVSSPWYDQPYSQMMMHLGLGLGGESGEVQELIKKQYARGSRMCPHNEWVSELGDVLWYLVAIACMLRIPLDEIWEYNCNKLDERDKEAGLK